MQAQSIVIAGSSGMIGSRLVDRLIADGHRVTRLVRHPTHTRGERQWDPEGEWLSPTALEGADIVINLAGASIARVPWTLAYKRVILSSRVLSTRTIVRAINAAHRPPHTLVNASAVGFYGNRPGEALTETSTAGKGFLSKVVARWEDEASAAAGPTRVVRARTGLVLGNSGALVPLRMLSTLALGGPIGDGTQYWPWISLDDEVSALAHLATASQLTGAVNLVAPHPAHAVDVTRTIAAELGRPHWLPAPAFAITAALADAGRELLLADQKVSSELLERDGFRFADVSLTEAVATALRR